MMNGWIQYTYVNGELKYAPRRRTAEEMLSLMARMHFLKQAGEEITVSAETNDKYEIIEYTVTRNMKDYTMFYRFAKQ